MFVEHLPNAFSFTVLTLLISVNYGESCQYSSLPLPFLWYGQGSWFNALVPWAAWALDYTQVAKLTKLKHKI
jgi:hypothetical protein